MNKLEHTSIVETYCQKLSELIQRMVQAADTAERKVLKLIFNDIEAEKKRHSYLNESQKLTFKEAFEKRNKFFNNILTLIRNLKTEEAFKDPSSITIAASQFTKDMKTYEQEQEAVELLSKNHPDFQNETKFFKTDYAFLPQIVGNLTLIGRAFEAANLKELIINLDSSASYLQALNTYLDRLKQFSAPLENFRLAQEVSQTQSRITLASETLNQLVKNIKDYKDFVEQMIKTINDAYKAQTDGQRSDCLKKIEADAASRSGPSAAFVADLLPKLRADLTQRAT